MGESPSAEQDLAPLDVWDSTEETDPLFSLFEQEDCLEGL